MTIALRTVGTEDQVIGDLQSALPGYEVDSWLTLNPGLTSSMEICAADRGRLRLYPHCDRLIGILNLMMMAVYERTREMGVLAALGLKGRQVMGIFLLEGARSDWSGRDRLHAGMAGDPRLQRGRRI